MISVETRRALESRFYPHLHQVVFGEFQTRFARCLGDDAVLLDSGSGPGTWIVADNRQRVRLWVGEDVYPPDDALWDSFVLAPCEALPFGDEVFDVVVAYLVLEHLASPERALQEYARVLKPGGCLCLKTPTVRTPLFLLAKLLPTTMHRRLKARIGTDESDVFPTYYRANAIPDLERCLMSAGLVRVWLRTVDQTYAYLSFRPWTYVAGLLYSRLTEHPALAFLRNQIIGIYQRPALPLTPRVDER